MSKFNYYAFRNVIMREMGFRSYEDYLASSCWTRIKHRVLEAANWSCRLCGSRATYVFHTEHSRMAFSGSSISSLVPLCATCYIEVEFDEHGNERGFGPAQAVYFALETTVDTARRGGPVIYPEHPHRKFSRRHHKIHRRCESCGQTARRGSRFCRPCEASGR